MGKDPFEDPELQAMRASMRPSTGEVRWGRIVTGVLVVASATFALAYYLPLRRAHETLTARFAELQSKVDSANRAAEESRNRAKELSDKTQALQTQLDGVQQREKSSAEASRALKSALESKLQKPIADNQAALGLAGSQAVASLSLGFLLTRGKLEVSPPGKAALCSIASAASTHSIRAVAIAGKKDIPAALAAKLKTPLEHNVAVAELVAKTLLDHCKTAPARLSAAGVPAEPASGPKLDGKRLGGARVELWLERASD
jgi:chemotaxis protein MotB